ncbi:hypothetical protein FA15DRAFT_593494 [Coprinopsis marcescibilis]|uniref:Uncharacterized protein n=1 Tax=Coprinopsis marcescibilis TaxID=230819 RepID=A0A5C3KTK3_COPMA|nr:hypothetical protein FA15DRAFT_593494 [Coprinopsis marcescibilis]
MSVTVPNKVTRVVLLQLTCVLATVAACIGLNALIRSIQQQDSITSKATPPMRIEVDVSQITNVGIVATVGNILIGLTAFFAFVVTFFNIGKFHLWANKTLRLQAYLLAFLSVWVIACMIPFMIFYYNDHATISAYIGDNKLADSLVASIASRSGHSTEYRGMWFLRLLAIFPWLSVASALITVPFLLKASKAVTSGDSDSSSSKEAVVTAEKAQA